MDERRRQPLDSLRVARRGRLKTQMTSLSTSYKSFLTAVLVVLAPLGLVPVSAVVDYVGDQGDLGKLVIRIVPSALLIVLLAALIYRDGSQEEPADFGIGVEAERRTFLSLAMSVVVPFGISLIMFWPVSNWSARLFGGLGDGYNWRWQIWRFGQELGEGNLFPTRFDDVIAPYGANLLLNDGFMSMYVGGFWNLLVGATLAYNLTLATSVFLNFWAAEKLTFRISASRNLALLGGVLFCTAPVLTVRQTGGHLNLCFPFVMCLVALEGHHLIETGRVRLARVAPLLILAFLSSFYFFVSSLFLMAIMFCFRVSRDLRHHRRNIRPALLGLSASLVLVVIVISPFLVSRLLHDSREIAAGAPVASARVDEYMMYSADPRMFVAPPGDSRFINELSSSIRTDSSPNTVENTPFTGFSVIVSVLLCLIVARKSRGLIAALWLFFSLLALGPTLIWGSRDDFVNFVPRSIVEDSSSNPVSWLPYSFLTEVPGLAALRTPNRFSMVLAVVGVSALALAYREFVKKGLSLRRRYFLASLALLGTLFNVRQSDYWYSTEYLSADRKALEIIRADESKSNVLIAGQDCLATIFLVNLQIEHRHPVIGCQTFSAAVPWFSGLETYKLSKELPSLLCERDRYGLSRLSTTPIEESAKSVLLGLRDSLNVGYIVFPKLYPCADSARTSSIVNLLLTGGEVLSDSAHFLIVSVPKSF